MYKQTPCDGFHDYGSAVIKTQQSMEFSAFVFKHVWPLTAQVECQLVNKQLAMQTHENEHESLIYTIQQVVWSKIITDIETRAHGNQLSSCVQLWIVGANQIKTHAQGELATFTESSQLNPCATRCHPWTRSENFIKMRRENSNLFIWTVLHSDMVLKHTHTPQCE